MKMAAIGFTLALAKEGAKRNIKANVIAPLAASRMMATVSSNKVLEQLPTSTVANMVAYLCHESCKPTGEIFELGGKWISKIRWQRSKGVVFPEDFTVEDVAARLEELSDFEKEPQYPKDGGSGSKQAMARL